MESEAQITEFKADYNIVWFIFIFNLTRVDCLHWKL